MLSFSDVEAPVERVEQKVAYWCGAACAKMITDYYGVPVLQREAFSQIHDEDRFETEKLWSDPLGLSIFLNDSLSESIRFVISDFSNDEKDHILSRIYYNTAILKIPSIVLVQNGGHWVVIDGIRVSEDADGEREFVGVEIQNPWFGLKPNVFVPVAELKENWITPNKHGVQWKGKLVMISDDRSDPVFKPKDAEIRIAGGGGGGDPTSLAIIGMETAGFSNIRPITSGGGAAVTEPTRIDVLGTGQHYFIVPLDAVRNERYRNFVYVAVDENGTLLGSTDLDGALQIFSDDEAMTIVRERLGNDDFIIRDGVYWTNSFYTMSRFDVFRVLEIGGKEYFLLPSGEIRANLDGPEGAGG